MEAFHVSAYLDIELSGHATILAIKETQLSHQHSNVKTQY